jgi:hypothetical protein
MGPEVFPTGHSCCVAEDGDDFKKRLFAPANKTAPTSLRRVNDGKVGGVLPKTEPEVMRGSGAEIRRNSHNNWIKFRGHTTIMF